MGANEEDTGLPAGFLGRRRRCSLDVDTYAKSPEGVVDEWHGKECTCGNAEAGEEEAHGDPEDGK